MSRKNRNRFQSNVGRATGQQQPQGANGQCFKCGAKARSLAGYMMGAPPLKRVRFGGRAFVKQCRDVENCMKRRAWGSLYELCEEPAAGDAIRAGVPLRDAWSTVVEPEVVP